MYLAEYIHTYLHSNLFRKQISIQVEYLTLKSVEYLYINWVPKSLVGVADPVNILPEFSV